MLKFELIFSSRNEDCAGKTVIALGIANVVYEDKKS